MNSEGFHTADHQGSDTIPIPNRHIESREWWLWGLAVTVTLVLTLGIISLTFFQLHPPTEGGYWSDLREWVRGLACVVLLFDCLHTLSTPATPANPTAARRTRPTFPTHQ